MKHVVLFCLECSTISFATGTWFDVADWSVRFGNLWTTVFLYGPRHVPNCFDSCSQEAVRDCCEISFFFYFFLFIINLIVEILGPKWNQESFKVKTFLIYLVGGTTQSKHFLNYWKNWTCMISFICFENKVII